jgi:hypothetical protein
LLNYSKAALELQVEECGPEPAALLQLQPLRTLHCEHRNYTDQPLAKLGLNFHEAKLALSLMVPLDMHQIICTTQNTRNSSQDMGLGAIVSK